MTRAEEIKKQAEKKAHEPSRLMHPYAKQYKVMSAYEIGFIEGAVWADEHPHWISVEDELPPKNEAYLAFWQHLGVTRYRFVKSGAKVSRTFSEHITHWMPLPQPPKSGSSEIPNNCEKGGKE